MKKIIWKPLNIINYIDMLFNPRYRCQDCKYLYYSTNIDNPEIIYICSIHNNSLPPNEINIHEDACSHFEKKELPKKDFWLR